jgi:hypothetical protein
MEQSKFVEIIKDSNRIIEKLNQEINLDELRIAKEL